MATRQRAPAINDRELTTCKDCNGQAVNPDHHPASPEITDCCLACNGLGKIDKKLGPLPTEQVAQIWRARTIHVNNRAKHLEHQLSTIKAAFNLLHDESHKPHPAAQTGRPGMFGAKRTD